MATLDEILTAVTAVKTRQGDLIDRLYGEGVGDIPAIRDQVTAINSSVRDHEGRIIKIETKDKIYHSNPFNRKKAATFGGSGTIILGILFGLGRLLSWW